MNFLSKFFFRRPIDQFLAFSPQESEWRAVTWNFDLEDPTSRLWTVEVLDSKQSQKIEWFRKGKDHLKFYKNGKTKVKTSCREGDGMKEMMNLALHSTLKYSMDINHEFLLTPVSGATALDFESEGRALQWLQGTFGTLQRALEQFRDRPDLILTAAVFSGKGPQSEVDVLRVLAFNLDIFLYLRPDFSLQVVVFDDRDKGHGSSKSPTFQHIIKVTKPQIYDEIVKLVQRIATVGEIK